MKVHKCVKSSSNILKPSASIFNTGTEPILFRISFPAFELRDHVRPIYEMSLKSTLISIVNVIGKILLFVLLGDLRIRVHISVVDNPAISLPKGKSFIDGFVKVTFYMVRRFVLLDLALFQLSKNKRPCRTSWLYYTWTCMKSPILTTDRAATE